MQGGVYVCLFLFLNKELEHKHNVLKVIELIFLPLRAHINCGLKVAGTRSTIFW